MSPSPPASEPAPQSAPDDEEVPERDLIRKAQEGDAEAARTLFDRYLPLLRRRIEARIPAALRSKLGESDVVQEASLAAFLALDKFRPQDPQAFQHWLGRILRNRLLDEIRRFGAQRRDARRDRQLPPQLAGTDASLSGVLMRQEERAAVWAAIDLLPSEQRRMVRLVHEDGLKLCEAAEVLGRSPDAGRKLYGRALLRLTKLLNPDDPHGAPSADA